MSTLTARLGLKKPQDSDAFLTTDFDGNYDILDSYPGVFVCTSTTRPAWSTAQTGQLAFATDTRTLWEWTGSTWREPLVQPAGWSISAGINTFVTPPSGGYPGTTSYTIGTVSSTRACSALLVAMLDYTPPPHTVVMSMSLGLTVAGSAVTMRGGRWAQEGYNYSTSLATAPTSDPCTLVGMGIANLNAGSNTVTAQVTISDASIFGGSYAIGLIDAAVSMVAINSSTT